MGVDIFAEVCYGVGITEDFLIHLVGDELFSQIQDRDFENDSKELILDGPVSIIVMGDEEIGIDYYVGTYFHSGTWRESFSVDVSKLDPKPIEKYVESKGLILPNAPKLWIYPCISY